MRNYKDPEDDNDDDGDGLPHPPNVPIKPPTTGVPPEKP